MVRITDFQTLVKHEGKERNIVQLFKEKMDKNFMTPKIIDYMYFDSSVIELSRGTGFEREPIFGLTHREYNERTEKFENKGFSKMFLDKEEMREAANVLKATNACKNITTKYQRTVCGKFKE